MLLVRDGISTRRSHASSESVLASRESVLPGVTTRPEAAIRERSNTTKRWMSRQTDRQKNADPS